MKLPKSIDRLTLEFAKLPGVGQKTASRLAFYLLKKDNIDLERLADAVSSLKKEVAYCVICNNMAETNICSVCGDSSRDHATICVVEETLDAQAIDATGAYKGTYHILGGVLSPLEGIGPEQLTIEQLMKRLHNETLDDPAAQSIQSEPTIEVILALNPTLEGETTSLDLMRRIRPLGIKVTRLARGLPIGGDLEYADEITISNALRGRSEN
jgi:recombination protein RecR